MTHSNILQPLFRIIETYIEGNSDPEISVIDHQTPEELSNRIDLALPERGVSDAELISLVEQYIQYSVRTGHPQFLNQLYQGFNLPGFTGEVVAALTNTSMYTYEVAPVATLIERELIARMCGLVGYENREGILVPGGSNANLTALLVARNLRFPTIREDGVSGRPVLFISDQAHYSFLKAANVLGLGLNSVIKVTSDSEGKMIPDKLERAVLAARDGGLTPFFVAATAGTTVLGAFDPIPELADVAERLGLWLHVDGALGGSAILSSKHKHLLRGIDRADSVAWNPHKTMGVPLVCSALLLKNSGDLEATTSCDHGDYLFHDEDSIDLGEKSLQCGRKVDALKLWLSWKYFGDRGYDERVTHLFDLASYAEQVIESDPRLRLVAPVQSFNVCFQYLDKALDESDLNDLNRTIRDTLLKSGKSMVNYATVNEHTAIRITFINPDIGTEDVDRFFRNVLEVAESIESTAC